ncbi:MAG TPA: hypothetical protein VIT91_17025 [Chthoniobacterales bacterium]
MKYSLPLFCAAFLAAASVASAQDSKKVVFDFENGLNDFGDNLEHDTTVAKNGKASAKLVADFTQSEGHAWTITRRTLDLPGKIARISFWVKSGDASFITFRLVDSTGQVHQSRPALEPTNDWQKVEIDAFDSGRRYQHYAGDDDGQVHWPATGIAFLIEKGSFPSDSGTIWIDDVEIVPAEGQ